MSKLKSVTAVLIAIFVLFAQGASANWYAGTTQSGAYGAWAYIRTPSVPPNIVSVPDSGEYNWVGTPGPNWIQTGWGYFPGNPARAYVETCINNCNDPPGRFFQWYDVQSWGTTYDYLIDGSAASNVWCVYINGVQTKCQSIRTAPSDIYFLSEILVSSRNGLDTLFDPVYYKNANYTWQVIDQPQNFGADFPYAVQVFTPWHFRTYRVITFDTFLPLIMK